jgi:hypothetical protein
VLAKCSTHDTKRIRSRQLSGFFTSIDFDQWPGSAKAEKQPARAKAEGRLCAVLKYLAANSFVGGPIQRNTKDVKMNLMLIPTSETVTMTSLEMVDFINSQRDPREAELRHDNFIAKVPQVLGELGALSFKDTYQHPQNKQTYPMYRFPKREACLMAMSYSYDLQAKVFDRMTELEQATKPVATLPDFTNPIEAARAWADQCEARMLAEKTKAQIGSRREATAMATASAATRKSNQLQIELDISKSYATVKRMQIIFAGHVFDWRMLKSATAELGLKGIDVPDQNYVTVKAWPAAAWEYAYNIRITDDGAEIIRK